MDILLIMELAALGIVILGVLAFLFPSRPSVSDSEQKADNPAAEPDRPGKTESQKK